MLKDYLEARHALDIGMNCSPLTLPLFSRHDYGAGNKILPFTSQSARNNVRRRAREALGADYDGAVTPRSLRHYYSFLTSIIKSLAFLHPRITRKCRPLFEQGLYDDAIFNAMKIIETEIRAITCSDPEDIGVDLITKAMKRGASRLEISTIAAEQESAYFLFRGAIGTFKNPLSHRFLETSVPVYAFECIALASLLMKMLDKANY